MQVGLTLSVIRQTVLHFNKVPLPISALLCKNLMQWFCYLYKCKETQRDRTWSKAPSGSWHTVHIHATPSRSSLHPTHLAPRRLPGHCPSPASSWAVQPGTSKHTHGRSALHTYFKVGSQAISTTGIRVQWFLPSEMFKFSHLPSLGWCSEAGWFLHTNRCQCSCDPSLFQVSAAPARVKHHEPTRQATLQSQSRLS